VNTYSAACRLGVPHGQGDCTTSCHQMSARGVRVRGMSVLQVIAVRRRCRNPGTAVSGENGHSPPVRATAGGGRGAGGGACGGPR
jgi:hypothetical protein